MNNISIFQKQLDDKRSALEKTEEWEFIKDDISLKTSSPKCIAYRRSKAYRYLKNYRLEIDQHKCHKCGCSKNLELHHLHYRTLFKENLTDVIILCRFCHGRSELIKKEPFQNKEIAMDNRFSKTLSKNFAIMVEWCVEYLITTSNKEDDPCRKTDKTIAERYKKDTVAEIIKLRESCGIHGGTRGKEGKAKMIACAKLRHTFKGIEKDKLPLKVEEFLKKYLPSEKIDKSEKVTNFSRKSSLNSSENHVTNEELRVITSGYKDVVELALSRYDEMVSKFRKN